MPGAWIPLPPVEEPADALEAEELRKDRVRLLLGRYGILFRELLVRELPELRWAALFRTLRLMELSGEILAGHFFHGVAGPQFLSHEALRRLRRPLPRDAVYWMNAADPASLCGLGLGGPVLRGSQLGGSHLGGPEENDGNAAPGDTSEDAGEIRIPDLPARRRTTWLSFLGSRLAVVARASGRRLEIRLAPDHERLEEALGFLETLLGRQVEPVKGLAVEEINGEPAATGPYAPFFQERFAATRESGVLRLRRRY